MIGVLDVDTRATTPAELVELYETVDTPSEFLDLCGTAELYWLARAEGYDP